MAIMPEFPAKLHEKLGDEAMNELATVFRELHNADARIEASLGALGSELKEEIAEVKIQISSAQAELVKWTFLFWVGTIGLVVLLLRFPK